MKKKIRMKKTLQYIRDVRLEWFKIFWPTRDVVVRSMMLIIVFSALFAAFLFVVDGIMTTIVKLIF